MTKANGSQRHFMTPFRRAWSPAGVLLEGISAPGFDKSFSFNANGLCCHRSVAMGMKGRPEDTENARSIVAGYPMITVVVERLSR
jgi:hypothetical protein